MLGDDLQYDLIHLLSRFGRETDHLVVSRILLLALLKMGITLAFL